MNKAARAPRRALLRARAALVLLALACAIPACVHAPASYRASATPLATTAADIELADPDRNRQLPVRVLSPDNGGPYPVVVFSHGGGSAGDRYDLLATHWAASGYVVILPTHRDSRRLGFSTAGASPAQMLDVLESRRRDLVFIADRVSSLASDLPALAGRIDADRIAVGGHSMGGATALTVTGLKIQDVRTRDSFGFSEPRFDALLLLTEPGNSPMMPERPWKAIPIPVFVATGSRDYSGQWNGPPKVRLYDFAPGLPEPTGVPRHYVYIEDMDHYLGGLVCRDDVPGPPDPGALAVIQHASTAFLDAYLKDDRAALDFLAQGKLAAEFANRATLTQR